jgi:hypothetical protein
MIPEVSAQSITPIIRLSLVTPEITVEVGPNENNVREFNGTIYIECPLNMSGTVTLSAYDPWNTARVYPSSFSFSRTNQGNRTFRVKIEAPKYVSSSANLTVKILGNWQIIKPTYNSGNCEPLEGKINIAKYHQLKTICPNKNVEVDPGEKYKFSLHIYNQGNGNDTFYINVTNMDYLKQNGIKISPESVTFELEELDKTIITFNVTAPDEIPTGKVYYIELEVGTEKSILDGGKVEMETLKIYIGNRAGFILWSCIGSVVIIISLFFGITIFYARWRLKKKKYVKKW